MAGPRGKEGGIFKEEKNNAMTIQKGMDGFLLAKKVVNGLHTSMWPMRQWIPGSWEPSEPEHGVVISQ